MQDPKTFYSKILLFGEYSIIKNSCALSYPYKLFSGKLQFKDTSSRNSFSKDAELSSLAKYLYEKEKRYDLSFKIDLHSLEFDISQGMLFKSTIPQGYGVGSSGALTASIYDRYCVNKTENINLLKKIFGEIESHFHGASSGVDPLISYLDRSVLVKSNGTLEVVDVPDYNDGIGGIFLLNTERSRRTEPLVNLFLEKCKSQEFDHLCYNTLSPITNRCVDNFLSKDLNELFNNFKELSVFQRTHFSPMIPTLFQSLWDKGLKTEKFLLKLCGAGGGGFLLGITKNFTKLKDDLGEHQVRPLFYF